MHSQFVNPRRSRLRALPLLSLLVACSAEPSGGRGRAPGLDANGNPIASGSGGSSGSAIPGATGGSGMLSGSGGAAVDPITGLPVVPVVVPPDISGAPGIPLLTPRFSRLSYRQWVSATKDVLLLSGLSGLEARITKDALAGFDNEAEQLTVRSALRADYQAAAEQLSAQIAGDPVALARLVPASAPADLAGKKQAFLTAFGTRAYRRPLTSQELDEASRLFDQASTLMPGKDPFLGGVELTLQFFLQSPHYLYRSELSTAQVGTFIPLNSYEVASKLSFALNNTMPDETLLGLASTGGLGTRDAVLAQALRLLGAPTASATLDSFHSQLLRFGGLDTLTKDTEAFPLFTPAVAQGLTEESLQFVRWVFSENRGIKDLLTSPVAFANDALASVYGLPGAFTSAFTQVALNPAERSGLLTRLAFLASNASRTNPSPIRRGSFINTRIFCKDLPPPTPNAAPLPPTSGMETTTNRQRVEAHTGLGSCGQTCHATIINPPGYAFENYSAIGGYRSTDSGSPVNAADQYEFTAGTPLAFNNGVEFSALAADNADAHNCISQQWMAYLHARTPAPEDAPLRLYLGEKSKSGALSLKDLVVAIVNHDAFLTRIPGGQ